MNHFDSRRMLLRAIGNPDQELAVWLADHPLTEPDVMWLAAHGLAGYAAHLLFSSAWASQISQAVRILLRDRLIRAMVEAELHSRELGRILDSLGAVQITPALFKGAVLAHTVYPDPTCRPMGDLDLWLNADEGTGSVTWD